ncbi:CPK2 [Symbiodinium sp. CCMP2456]|nr:CPK2 [Symbiodinium sp. CCMP2456]
MVGQPAHSPCALEVVCSRTTCGDELFLCGGHEILGAWEVGRALKLYTQKESFPVWKLQLPASLAGEFKLLVKRRNGNIEWEGGENRFWPSPLPSGPGGRIHLRFGEPGLDVYATEVPKGSVFDDASTSLPSGSPWSSPSSESRPMLPLKRHRTKSDCVRSRLIHATSLADITQKACIWDRYELEDTTLGEGAFGTVRKARDRSLGTMRAVKRIDKAKSFALEDVRKEIEMLREMDHPSIVRLYAAYEDSVSIYLVMELCEGGELFDRLIEESHLTEPAVQTIMRQVFGAVAHCHDKHIVHRDLKPENFILQKRDAPVDKNPLKLIDFGLAEHCEPGDFMHTAFGTILYVAPEVLQQQYDRACDIWSCGVMMYCLLCGSPPFHGSSDAEIMHRVMRGKFSMRGTRWSPVSDVAKNLIEQCLNKDRQKRITAADALNHPWFQRPAEASGMPLHPDLLANLKAFSTENRFKKAALTAAAYQLTDEEQEEIRQTFQRLDSDCDGFVTLEDLQTCFQESVDLSPLLNVAEVMDNLDHNQDGRLEYTEFIAAAMDQRLHRNEQLCWRAFKAFDRDGDNRITYPDLQHVLQDPDLLHEVPNCRSAWQYFQKMDVDGDGEVTFDDFMRMLRAQNSPTSPSIFNQMTFGTLTEGPFKDYSSDSTASTDEPLQGSPH